MAAADTNAAMEYDSTADITAFASNIVDGLVGQERSRLQAQLSETEGTVTKAQTDLASGQTTLDTWNKSTLYRRSPYDASTLPTSNLTPTQKAQMAPYASFHKQIVGMVLSNTQMMLDMEKAGKQAQARSIEQSVQQLIDLFSPNNAYAFYAAIGMEFARYGMKTPASVLECRQEIARQQSHGLSLEENIRTTQETLDGATKRRQETQTTLTNESYDLRPYASTLDGNAPQERAAWDSAIEQWGTSVLDHPLSIDLETSIADPRVQQADDRYQAKMTSAESTDLMTTVAKVIAETGIDQAALRATILTALEQSPLSDVLEQIHAPAEDFSELATQIAAKLAEQAEANNAIPYAKMLVTVHSPNNVRTDLLVRIKNPGDRTVIDMRLDNGDGSTGWRGGTIEHPGGTAESVWGTSFERSSGWRGGMFEIKIWDGPERNILLDRVEGWYRNYENSASIITQQHAWDRIETGRTAEVPVQPDLRIAEISGPNILFTVASPYDQSVVMFEQAGALTRADLPHAGGTVLNMGQVTFSAEYKTGNYALNLYDRGGGRIIDSVMMHWDQEAKKVTMVHSADGYGQGVEGPLTEEQYEIFRKINGITSASLGNAHINWIQQMRFYEMTGQLPKPLDFQVTEEELMEKIWEARPHYRSENYTAELKRRQQARPDMQPGVVEQWFNDEIRMFKNEVVDSRNKYEAAMGEILQAAVNVFIRIRQGADQRGLLEGLDAFMERWTNPYQKPQYNQYSLPLRPLSLIGIGIPPRHLIVDAGKKIFEMGWEEMMRRQEDVVSFRQYQEAQREKGLRQNALGQFVAITKINPEDVPKEMSRRQISTALKIERARAAANHPVTRLLAKTVQDRLNIQTALRTEKNTPVEEIAKTYVALVQNLNDNDVIAEIGGAQTTEELSAWKKAYATVFGVKKDTLYADLSNLYQGDKQSTSVKVDNMLIKTDSVASRIALGFMEKSLVIQDNPETLAELCLKVEAITGIPAKYLYGLARTYQKELFTRRISELFMKYGYAINVGFQISATVDEGLQPGIDYLPGIVRVHFDPSTSAGPISHFQTNVVYVPTKENVIENVIPVTKNQLYVDIPAEIFRDIIPDLGIKVIGYETAEKKHWGISVTIDRVKLASLSLNTASQLSTAETPERKEVEGEIFKLLEKRFPFDLTDTLTWEIGSAYHDGDDFYAVDLNKRSPEKDDFGEPLYPIKDGGRILPLSESNESLGTITIEYDLGHINGKKIKVYTEYMHTLIEKRTTDSGTIVYDILNNEEKTTGISVWANKIVNSTEQVASIGGRGSGYNRAFSPHLHGKIWYMIDGEKFDLDQRPFLEKKFTIYATDVGLDRKPDILQGNPDDGLTLQVRWDKDIGTWVNDEHKVAFDHFTQQEDRPVGSNVLSWMAWEGNDAHVMKKIVRKKVGEAIDVNGKILPLFKWISIDNPLKEWVPSTQSWATIQ